MQKQIRLSGAGGQGVISLGVMIAEASMNSGKKVIQSQTYGPEARGGTSKCEVIVSEDEIYFTKVVKPDIFLVLNESSYKTYFNTICEDTVVIVDDKVVDATGKNVHSYPIVKTAIDEFGKEIFANVIAFGIISQILEIDEDMAIASIKKRTPKDSETKNIAAFNKGKEMYRK